MLELWIIPFRKRMSRDGTRMGPLKRLAELMIYPPLDVRSDRLEDRLTSCYGKVRKVFQLKLGHQSFQGYS